MKIAYIYQSINTNFAEPFAVQLHIYHQIHGLQQAGHQVNLLALQGRRVLCTGNLEVFQNSERLESDFGKLGLSGTRIFKVIESAIRRIQRKLKFPYLAIFDNYRTYDACCQNLQHYDVIHERYNLFAFGGAWASRQLGIPYVLEVNADLLEERRAQGHRERSLRRLFAQWTTRFCFDSAKRIVCVSAQLKDHLVQKWKVAEEKIVVLPNAADTDAFGRRYEVREIRTSLGLEDEPVVMFVGGFYLWHDLGLLVQSFRQVLRVVPDAKLILVGDGRTRPMVEQLVAEHGLQTSVVMTGAIEHRRVPELLAIANVAVAPNISFFDGHGGSPLKIYEYMAAGKAIVATRTGQVSEVIQHGHNGILVEVGDHDGFAEATINLLAHPITQGRLGRQARKQAVEQHSWAQYAKHLVGIYLNCIRSNVVGIVASTLPSWTRESLRRVRDAVRAVPSFRDGRYCPVCGKSSRRFRQFGLVPRNDAQCTHCGALERHRLIWLFFQKKTDLFDGKPKKMLHVAPEVCFESRLKKRLGSDYLTADLYRPTVMVKMDITNIQYADQSFDVIYCSHVLEHVLDDRQAMREFARVLKSNGWAVLIVPITSEKTYEDSSIVDPKERLKAFGQVNHVRRYGLDYVDRLREAGFNVEITKVADLVNSKQSERMGLTSASGVICYCTK